MFPHVHLVTPGLLGGLNYHLIDAFIALTGSTTQGAWDFCFWWDVSSG